MMEKSKQADLVCWELPCLTPQKEQIMHDTFVGPFKVQRI